MEEEISKQVQEAVAPFTKMAQELRDGQEKSHKLLEDHMVEAKGFFDQLEKLDDRYEANGVEWKKAMQALKSLEDHTKEQAKKIDEVFQPYRDAKGVARTIKWVGGIILTISSVIAALKFLIFKV